ncbi:MAG: hypothetical protein ACW975_00240 [Candidatus Thorarchaeota archaeon]|jgi:hypothetical protein
MNAQTKRQVLALLTSIIVLISFIGFLGFIWTRAPSRIAVVKPIFSRTAYRDAFYTFYQRYGWVDPGTYITNDLDYLNVTVKDGWGFSEGLSEFLGYSRLPTMIFGMDITYIDEIDVIEGALFSGAKRVYDVLILGFTEYVTQEEYTAYKTFVAMGGLLIIVDACNFLAEVKYHPPDSPDQPGYLSLVKGHGWEFNGTHAWRSVYHRWPEENRNWVGSNFWRFWQGIHYDQFIANTSHQISTYLETNYGTTIDTGYGAHEENKLENFTDTEIIGYWNFVNWSEAPDDPVVAYQHWYVNGSVIHTGIVASRWVDSERYLMDFMISAIRLGLTGEVGDWEWV